MHASELHRLARTLREIALDATGTAASDRMPGGRLAVLEDVARNAGASIAEITERTGLAQSLVSRIVRAAADEGALTVEPDAHDRRRVRVDLTGEARSAMLDRAGTTIDDALAVRTPSLRRDEREALLAHLEAAAALLERRSAGAG